MARNTGVDILSIKPDPEMGLGQDSNIPVPAVALDQVNKAAQDIRMYDHQRQLMKYDNELKRQDKLLEALANGQVAVGAIEPEDKAEFDRLENETRKAFLAVKSMEPDRNGQNKEYEAYKSKLQDLKDYQAAAQHKHVQLNELRKKGAEINTDAERAEFNKFFENQRKKYPGQIIDPYIKTKYADFERLNKYQTGAFLENGKPLNLPATTTTDKVTVGPKGTTSQVTTTTKPLASTKSVKGIPAGKVGVIGEDGMLPIEYTEPDKAWSYPEVYRNSMADAMTLDGLENQRKVWETFQGNPDITPKKYLTDLNKRLELFHTQNNIPTIKIQDKRPGPINPDNPNDTVGGDIDTGAYENQINYDIDKDGRIIMRDDPITLAAKIALANVKGDYLIKGKKVFNEDAFKLNMEKAKNKAEVLALGAKAQADRARAGYYFAKAGEIKDKDQQEKAINDGWTLNLTSQKKLTEKSTDGSMTLAKLPNTETTPIFGWSDGDATKPVIIKPIGAKTIYGSDPQNPATYGKPVGYEGGYYEQEYTRGGYPVSPEQLLKIYQKYSEDENAKGKEPVPMDDFLKMAIKEGKVDVKIRGERGSTTRLFHTQAFKKAIGSSKNYTNFIQEEDQQ